MAGKTTPCLIPAVRGACQLLPILTPSRESEACGAGALAAAAPSLVVHTHGCLAVLQAKLETELITLLTGAQVYPAREFVKPSNGQVSEKISSLQVLSLLVLLASLICLVVALCTGNHTDIQ